MPYTNVPESLWDKMDACVEKVQGQGHPKDSAIAICHTSIVEGKSIKEATQLWMKRKLSEMKQGARHSAGDANMIQTIHDHSASLGADCSGAGKSLAIKMIAGMQQMNGVDYAIHEGWDIQQCCSVISQLSAMCQDECSEGEMDEALQLCNIMMSLMDHCKGECQEMMDAMQVGENIAPAYAETKSSPLNLSYVKSLHLDIPDDKLAVKFVGKDQIKGYAILWGDEKKVDLEQEYFTKDTNFWDNNPQWLTWDHAQDEEWKADPRIGNILEVGDDQWGKWYIAKLKRAETYRKYLDDLIERKSVGSSSDSAPQYVKRVKTGKSIWLQEWPLFAVSLTDAPCEPRMIGSIEYLKSLGVQLPDARTAWEWNRQRLNFLKFTNL